MLHWPRSRRARSRGEALSVGLVGNIAEVLPELVRRGVAVDVVTDQTSAHDLRVGYLPVGMTLDEAEVQRESDPTGYEARVLDSMVLHVQAMREFQKRGAIAFDYGNNLRGQVADHRGMPEAFEIPGFVPEFIRPLFCKGAGPFRWAALSGDPADIATTDDAVLETFPKKDALRRWIEEARRKVQFQGLPARICWLEYGERAEMGLRFNWLVKHGKVARAAGHRPRPPRHRQRRLAESRNRGDARRLGRHRRLATPECHAEHRLRGQLGLDPPRRWRRHRVFLACRDGRRGRRDRDGRSPAASGS